MANQSYERVDDSTAYGQHDNAAFGEGPNQPANVYAAPTSLDNDTQPPIISDPQPPNSANTNIMDQDFISPGQGEENV